MKIKEGKQVGFLSGVSATFKALPFMSKNGLLIWFLPALGLTLAMSYGAFALIDIVVETVSTAYEEYFGVLS